MTLDLTERKGSREGELALRTLAMPADTNVNGGIIGGWVPSQMGIAGGIVAGLLAKGRVATAAIESMKFIRPVRVGDVLCIYWVVERIGRTSMAIRLESWVLRNRIGDREKVTEAIFTFVALGGNGRPRPLPAEAQVSS